MRAEPTDLIECARRVFRIACAGAFIALHASIALGQTPAVSSEAASEELEPRIVGSTGTTTIGFSGFVDRFMSVEKTYSTNYAMHMDVARFLTKHISVTGGMAGMGSVGGEDEDVKNRATGVGAPSLYLFGGGLYYFTPQSIASVYLGASYWQQVTARNGPDAGAAVGTVGLQGAVSSRAAFFVEGGYGFGFTRGSREELVTRILGRVGMRLKL